MASKDSGEIATNSNYALGDYSFRIERSSVPGSTNDKIEAICTDKDGKNARKSIQVLSSTKLDGYYVEANETEATVYALVQVLIGDEEHTSPLVPGPVASGSGTITGTDYGETIILLEGGTAGCIWRDPNYDWRINYVTASSSSFSEAGSFTYDGKTVYARSINGPDWYSPYNVPINSSIFGVANEAYKKIAWTMIYGVPSGDEYETKEIMIGRFAIDIEDAGGVGPGSDWIDPGDYDPDWEEGDPTHTLYVTVTGALSGRHNDPIVDPSYSYIPADKDTVKDYGCGGDGGHGGGGGAGASTVVIHKFATNQANSKEVTALARRHGYGSGGGKGGKGGDGCILVYY